MRINININFKVLQKDKMLVFQVLGKMFQFLQEMSRSCMSYQGVSSFDTLV